MPEYQDTTVGELRISAGKNQDNLRFVAELQEAWISFVSELPERPSSDGWSRVLWTERTQLTEATARLRPIEAFKNHKDILDFLDLQSIKANVSPRMNSSDTPPDDLGISNPCLRRQRRKQKELRVWRQLSRSSESCTR
jgi:hypothetical protein